MEGKGLAPLAVVTDDGSQPYRVGWEVPIGLESPMSYGYTEER